MVELHENCSLLRETNDKLCDQVEIFEAISAVESIHTGRRAPTNAWRLRQNLVEEDARLQSASKSYGKQPIRGPLFSFEGAMAGIGFGGTPLADVTN